MTLTIVKGVAGKGQTQDVSPASQVGRQSSQPTQALNSTTASAASVVSSNAEAAVSNVRARNQSQGTDKVREFKRAQELAGSVAEDVLVAEESLNVHGLQDSAARHHLS
jgi:hypothetical protein